jgi:glycosyltransferase involved in cell wall biosynthesis
MPGVTAIIPAYNEAERIATVIAAAHAATRITEILVVDDGSLDTTASVAAALGVRVLSLGVNQGKGAALRAGATQASGEWLLFLDADLQGITPEHLDALVEPVVTAQATMAIGIFTDGRPGLDLAQNLAPMLSGQRCLSRAFFLSTPLVDGSRQGVEIALTVHARASQAGIAFVSLPGVTHCTKEEKLGVMRGVVARGRMYAEILATLARYYLPSRRFDRPVSTPE